jgi:glutathione S-transferase
MAEDLKRAPFLAGDTFTNADCAVIPYILRLELLKLDAMWEAEPAVAEWWARMQQRASVKAAIFDRMEESDWAPFKALSPDPWPRVKVLLAAAE